MNRCEKTKESARLMRDILRQVQDAVHEKGLMPQLVRAEALYREATDQS